MKKLSLVGVFILASGCSSNRDHAIAALILDSPPHPRLPTCLIVFGKDPNPLLLAELRSANRRVEAGSKCTKGPFGGIYIDGQRAEKLAIHKFLSGVPWRASIEFSTYTGPLGGSGWTVHMKRINGKWFVQRSEMRWISLGPNNSFKPKPLRGSA